MPDAQPAGCRRAKPRGAQTTTSTFARLATLLQVSICERIRLTDSGPTTGGLARQRLDVFHPRGDVGLGQTACKTCPDGWPGAATTPNLTSGCTSLDAVAVGVSTKRVSWQVGPLWYRTLVRRSQKKHLNLKRMDRLLTFWLPPVRILHPYPCQRLIVTTQGRSRMR